MSFLLGWNWSPNSSENTPLSLPVLNWKQNFKKHVNQKSKNILSCDLKDDFIQFLRLSDKCLLHRALCCPWDFLKRFPCPALHLLTHGGTIQTEPVPNADPRIPVPTAPRGMKTFNPQVSCCVGEDRVSNLGDVSL